MASPHQVVLYTRAGCHLCDEVKATLTRLEQRGGLAFKWKEVDIDSDPDLHQKYNEEVPVVFIDGKKAFKYRMDEGDFLRALAAR
jgi:glutaredoxin